MDNRLFHRVPVAPKLFQAFHFFNQLAEVPAGIQHDIVGTISSLVNWWKSTCIAHQLTKTTLPAGIYVRISLDKHDDAGVEQCRSLAAEVGCVYLDNSISAYSGKVRPGFIDLVIDVKARKIGAYRSCPTILAAT